MSEEEFLQESVDKMISEIYNYHVVDNDPAKKDSLKAALFDKLKEYDTEFYKRYNKAPLSELQNQFSQQQQNFRDLPDHSIIQQNLMKNTFVSDAGYLTRYQRLHKITNTHPTTQPLNVNEPPPPPARDYEKEFIDTRFNFKDTNLNQKMYLTNPSQKVNTMIGERDNYLNQLEQNKYQQDLLCLMKQPQLIGIDAQPYIENHKKKIEMLGGIEDTVGAMERSLNEFNNSSSQHTKQYANTAKPIHNTYQREGGQTDTFLKDYSQRVPNQVVERSKQLREQMMRRMQNQ